MLRITPVMSSLEIILFRAKSLALWLVTKRNLSKLGFKTAWIGMLYIPGRRSGLKAGEYLPTETSFSIWEEIKSHSNWDLKGCHKKSQVVGHSL